MPTLSPPMQVIGIALGAVGILTGIYYRKMLKWAGQSPSPFYELDEAGILASLTTFNWKSKRFRFFFPRAVMLLILFYSGVAIGAITLVYAGPVMVHNILG